ncbi:MAG: hypothetical protein ACON3Z_15635 [Bradymonadia bacterium]
MYRVTRGGQDIYEGQLDGLLEAAREGDILANDLIFDASIEKWVFARSLSALTGFPLKGRRLGGGVEEPIQQVGLNEGALIRRAGRRRRAARFAALALIATSAAVLIWLVPDVTDAGDSGLKRFVRPESSNGVKFEGTGRGFEKAAKGGQGPSNMDGRSVTVDGVEGEGGAGSSDGRQAGLLPGAAPMASPNRGAAEGSPNQEAMEPSVERTPAEAKRNIVRLPEPRGSLARAMPANQADGPATFIRPVGQSSIEDAVRELDKAASLAERVSLGEQEQEGLTLEELIEARHRAEFAVRRLSGVRGSQAPLDRARQTVSELEKVFLQLCAKLYSARYCEIRSAHPAWPEVVTRAVEQQRPLVGMNLEQLEKALGRPQMLVHGRNGVTHCYGIDCKPAVRVQGALVVSIEDEPSDP